MKKRTALQVKNELYKIAEEYAKLQDVLRDLDDDIENLQEEYYNMVATIPRLKNVKDIEFSDYILAKYKVKEALKPCKCVLQQVKPKMNKLKKEYDKLRKEFTEITGEKFNLINS